jgi:O-antigen ligase
MIKKTPLTGKYGQKAQASSVGLPPTGYRGSSNARMGQSDTQYSALMIVVVSVLLVFMVVPEGFDYQAVKDGIVPESGSPVSRLIWITLFLCSFSIVIGRLQQARSLLSRGNVYIWAFVFLAFASIVWSNDPGVTIRRMIRVFTVTFSALAFALVAWKNDRLQSVLRIPLTGLMLGSIAFVMSSPELSIEVSDQFELAGAWHGLATQKNGFGSIASIATLLWAHALVARSTKRYISLSFLCISFYCLLKSRSSTCIMSTIFAIMLMLLMIQAPKGLKRYMPYIIGIFVSVILVYSLAVLRLVPGLDFILKPVVAITGKDLTFSGRTEIWAIVNESIAMRPILGIGYGAYWTGPNPGSPSYEHLAKLFFYPGQAHSGYLDVVNDLGIVGGIVLVGYLVTYLRQAIHLFMLNRMQGIFFLMLYFQQLIANLSEAHWFNVFHVEFAIMTISTMALSRAVLQAESDHRWVQKERSLRQMIWRGIASRSRARSPR